MGRPKGSKNKDAEKKLEDALELAAQAHEKAESEEQKAEIEEAVESIADAMVPDVKGEKLVGVHPITGKPVYV